MPLQHGNDLEDTPGVSTNDTHRSAVIRGGSS